VPRPDHEEITDASTDYRSPPVCLAVGFLAVLLGGTLLQAALRTLFPTLTTEILAVATMAGRGMVALALVAWFGWREEVGLTPPSRWRNVHLAWLLLPLPLIALLDGVRANDPSRIAFLALAALFVAVNEELFFRGLLLRALQPWGDLVAVAVLAASSASPTSPTSPSAAIRAPSYSACRSPSAARSAWRRSGCGRTPSGSSSPPTGRSTSRNTWPRTASRRWARSCTTARQPRVVRRLQRLPGGRRGLPPLARAAGRAPPRPAFRGPAEGPVTVGR
jgi:hypothetical protein